MYIYVQVPFERCTGKGSSKERETKGEGRKEGRSVGPGCSVKEKPLIRRCWGEIVFVFSSSESNRRNQILISSRVTVSSPEKERRACVMIERSTVSRPFCRGAQGSETHSIVISLMVTLRPGTSV